MEPTNPRLLFYYAQFLLFKIEDIDKAFRYAQQVYDLRPESPYTVFLFSRCYSSLHYYNEAINLIAALLKTNLNVRDKRVAFTELISLYNKKAFCQYKVEANFSGSIETFKGAIEIFVTCEAQKNIDYKLIKSFVDGLYNFIATVPVAANSDNIEFIKSILIKYDAQISLTPIRNKLLQKFQDKYEIQISELKLDTQNENEVLRLSGNVSKPKGVPTPPYVFIEAATGRFYANKNDFQDVNSWDDWIMIKNGQLVTFEVGENFEGPCAVRLKLVS